MDDIKTKQEAALIATAWELYCKETAGSMDIRDFWYELTPRLQEVYLHKAKEYTEYRKFRRMWNTLKGESGNRTTYYNFAPGHEIVESLREVMDRIEDRFKYE